MIRFHLRIETDNLSDFDWASRWNELKWILEEEAKKYKN